MANQTSPTTALIVAPNAVRLYSMTGADRLRRSFARIDPPLREADGTCDGAVIVIRGDYAYEERLLKDLAARPGVALTATGDDGVARIVAAHGPAAAVDALRAAVESRAPAETAPEGLRALNAAELSGAYNHTLRKRETPLIAPIIETGTRAIEWRLFGSSYKGVTDFVTKFVWPRPAFAVTRWCAALGLTPNMVTFVSFLLVLWVMDLFANGLFLPGVFLGWLMCFLDTVDGKLARVTLRSSPWGNVFDHGIDLIHPPFWYAAWWWGLTKAGPGGTGVDPETLRFLLYVIVGGYVLGRLEEAFFLHKFKIQIHTWRRIDSQFRLITARRNPNLFILMIFALIGAPGLGFAMIAVWTVASIGFHLGRILLAIGTARQGPLRSWLLEGGEPAR